MNYYIHVPFCRSKCGYCAFYSETGASDELVGRYIDKISSQLQSSCLPPAETIYFGGGTPTLLKTGQLYDLLETVLRRIRVTASCEISMECNPETLDAEKLDLLREYVTRISLGIQSFDPDIRRTLGRNCSCEAISRAIPLIRERKFDHFNCDLIYAVPGQSCEGWIRDLETAAQSGADHISCYNLTPEEQSRLGKSFIIDEDDSLEMYHTAEKVLAKFGIERYEISNYSRPGAECRHNVNVWRGGLLSAFGPAAASFDGSVRYINVENTALWLEGAAPEVDRLGEESRSREIFAVNLRTVRGWSRELWCGIRRTGWDDISAIFDRAVSGLPGEFFVRTPEIIRLTPTGLLYWNDIAEKIIL